MVLLSTAASSSPGRLDTSVFPHIDRQSAWPGAAFMGWGAPAGHPSMPWPSFRLWVWPPARQTHVTMPRRAISCAAVIRSANLYQVGNSL